MAPEPCEVFPRPDQTTRVPGDPFAQFRMLTARETTTATVTREARDWNIISSFAQSVSGMVSVGLNAVALVNDVYR